MSISTAEMLLVYTVMGHPSGLEVTTPGAWSQFMVTLMTSVTSISIMLLGIVVHKTVSS